MLFRSLFERYFSSSIPAPTVDGITLTNEEIDFIRGIRSHENNLAKANHDQGESNAELLMQILEEGPENAKTLLQDEPD